MISVNIGKLLFKLVFSIKIDSLASCEGVVVITSVVVLEHVYSGQGHPSGHWDLILIIISAEVDRTIVRLKVRWKFGTRPDTDIFQSLLHRCVYTRLDTRYHPFHSSVYSLHKQRQHLLHNFCSLHCFPSPSIDKFRLGSLCSPITITKAGACINARLIGRKVASNVNCSN